MADRIAHRGPDGAGSWVDPEAGLALGHRRLAILDLSPAGVQPMVSASGRFVLCYNGEIYNHLDLRRSLEEAGHAQAWRGHSDTETLLAAIEAWGLARALKAAAGMFAFALWDRKERRLSLARDRMGEKPLYYGRVGRTLVFASELKALRAYPGFGAPVDPVALTQFLRLGYVPDPRSIYLGILKLPAGSILTLASPDDDQAWPERFWQLGDVIQAGAENPVGGTYTEQCDALETCLRTVVQSQMLSDVPLGSFLSGGIDSSLVTALMRNVTEDVRTFSIGFEDARLDEASHARRVAQHLQTRHTEFLVTEADALAVVPDIPRIYDEPFADSSQIPTTLLSRLARQDVTAALTGDGGDEVFGGYNRHMFFPRLWRLIGPMPEAGRRGIGRSLELTQRLAAGEAAPIHRLIRAAGLPLTTIDKLGRLGAAIGSAKDYAGFYRSMVSILREPAPFLMRGALDPADPAPVNLGLAEWTMASDALAYLPGDILVKVDRAAMSASLETRAPFLDARVVELAWRLPISAKVGGGKGKRILRDVLYRHVPRDLVDRPKQGFAVPLNTWLRGGLRDWAEAQLDAGRMQREGVLNAGEVRALWERHLTGRSNAGPELWNLLMLQAWIECAEPAFDQAEPVTVPA